MERKSKIYSIIIRNLMTLPSHTNQILVDKLGENIILARSRVLEKISINEILQEASKNFDVDPKNIKPTPSSPTKLVKRSGVLGLQNIFGAKKIAYLKDSKEIMVVDFDLEDTPKTLIDSLITNLNGLKRCSNNDILLWSNEGIIKKYNYENSSISEFFNVSLPNDDYLDNSLNSLDFSENGEDLILGDKLGNIWFYQKRDSDIQKDIFEDQDEDTLKDINSIEDKDDEAVLKNQLIHSKFKLYQSVRAHESSINDLIYFKIGSIPFIATASRDRTIQIFYKIANTWTLFQTLSIHKGNVLKLKYFKNNLYASSSDRNCSIHRFFYKDEDNSEDHDISDDNICLDSSNYENISIELKKLISVKNSPVYFDIYHDDLIISTNDKKLTIFNLHSLESIKTIKLMNKYKKF
ncbi:unnamed protein product [[Candida] boidinii]|nr:unnamed protein product [[Candida] boidinii]